MKVRIFVVVLLVTASAIAGRWVNRADSHHMSRQEETRQTFRLDPGARVEVRGINGKVEVVTGDTDVAEVHILRTAEDAEDLGRARIAVEGASSYLCVRAERGLGGGGLWHKLFGGGRRVREEVTLRVPRGVELSASSVNGQLRVGEVEGSVEIGHVNGRVEVAQAAGRAEVRHVNGNVTFGVSRPGQRGLDVEHVNGNIEIRLKQLFDADIEVQRQNGSLLLGVPNVTMQERLDRSNTRARLGAGGTPFQISHINGNVRFASDAPAGAQTASAVPGVAPLPPVPPAPPAP